MEDEKLTRIEQLKRQMYSRQTEGLRGTREHQLRAAGDQVKTDWEHAELPQIEERPHSLVLRVFLIFSIAFFLAALGYGSYLYFGGGTVISSQNIGVQIEGPVSLRGGETLPLSITVSNRNATPLEIADLLVEYPEGTRDPKNLSKELLRSRESLGDIAPGAVIKKSAEAVLFGSERETKIIKITVEYHVPGSNAMFYKESEYQVVISSAPLSVSVDAPTEANSGQGLVLRVNVKSNSPEIVKDVIMVADYPAGYAFDSAEPVPASGNAVWRLGDMQPGSSRSFTVRGKLTGENLDARIFRFNVGIADPRDSKKIGTPFANASEEISINKPFIGLSIVANGSTNEAVPIRSGNAIELDINYVNNLLVPVSDVAFTLELSGEALDKNSVSTSDGFYRSVDNTVIWDKTTSEKLELVGPGEDGTLHVSLAARSLSGGITTLRNPQISVSANVRGKRVESGRVPEELQATAKRRLQVQSDVAVNQRLVYYAAAIPNSGPMPPRAEKETKYNVIWTITNGSNDLADARVIAQLPAYVKFVKGLSGEDINWSDVDGAIIWNAGTVRAGTGYGLPPRQAVFQIALTPSVSQIGETPKLLTGGSLTATDHFTNSKINLTLQPLDSHLFSDPSAKIGDDTVLK